MATALPGGVAVDSPTPVPTAARADPSVGAASTSSHAAADTADTADTEACRRFATAAVTVGDAETTLGQARRAAARRFGTPRLQALYDGAGRGRDPQQELCQARGARVMPQVQLVADPHGHDPLPDPAQHHPTGQHERRQVDVLVTGVTRAADRLAARVQPYQQPCLLLTDPVPGWLADDVHTERQPDTPAVPDGS
jgi:hypothetical protein